MNALSQDDDLGQTFISARDFYYHGTAVAAILLTLILTAAFGLATLVFS